jgi:hypothetical protein
MRINAKEGFTVSNKAGNVQNRIGRKLMQLYAINKKKPAKKLVGRKVKGSIRATRGEGG